MWELQDIDPLPTWCRGRAILVGDAARMSLIKTKPSSTNELQSNDVTDFSCVDAMTPLQGQGANMSIEDGEAFRLLLQPGVAPVHVPTVLKQIDGIRRPRVAKVLKNTREATFGLKAEERLARLLENADYEGILALAKGTASTAG